jgi:hypothetical protein
VTGPGIRRELVQLAAVRKADGAAVLTVASTR